MIKEKDVKSVKIENKNKQTITEIESNSTSELETLNSKDIQVSENAIKKAKKRNLDNFFRYIKGFSISFSISAIIFFFGLFWQDDSSLMAIGDSLWLTFTLVFFAGWIMYVYNKNIFSPLIFGVKSFILMFFGTRPKDDYYNFMKKIENKQILPFYFVITFITALIIFIPAIITLIILV